MKFNASIAITGPLSTKWLDLTKDVADPVYAEARLFWDDSNKTYSLYNDDSSIKLPVGTQTRTKVYNNTGFDISSGKCVSITGTHANGNGYVALTDVTDDVSKSNIVGFTLSDIVSGGFGYVLMQGKLIGVNTSAFPNSTAVWLSISEAGGLQSTAPESPRVLAGTILVSHITAGTMLVNIRGGEGGEAGDHLNLDQTTPQTVINGAPIFSAGINLSNLTASQLLELDVSKNVISVAKATAHNKAFGATVGTVAEGNDSRIDNGQTAFGWGDHSGTYVGLLGNETVAGIKTFSSFSVTPSSAPTSDYNVANKKYVDDAIVSAGGYTNEQAQDAVGGIMSGSGATSVVYDDTANTIVISSTNTTYTNVSEFTNDSGYITGYTETDPIFIASPSFGITNTNISNWNTAHGWGDHSTQGYLTSETDSQTIQWNPVANQLSISNGNTQVIDNFEAPVTFAEAVTFEDEIEIGNLTSGILVLDGTVGSITDNSSNWNTAFGWGDHSVEGYITSYTETDPIFTASAAFGITATNISNWNTAHGWGDHSTQGYLTSETDNQTLSFVDATGFLTISGTGNTVDLGLTTADKTNWNTAFGWGDHSVEGYITSAGITASNGLTKSGSDIKLGGSLANVTLINTAATSLAIYNSSSGGLIQAKGSATHASGFGSAIFGFGDASGFLVEGFNAFSDKFEFISDNGKGIEYDADYSAGFVARSLVDKGYVDGAITTGTLDWIRADADDSFSGVLTGGSSARIVLNNVNDVSLSSTLHALQIGPTTGLNVIFDNNEIQARNNGAIADFFLQAEGGNLGIFDNTPGILTVNGDTTILADITADAHITDGGTSSQFVKGDGTLDPSTFVDGSGTTNFVTKWIDADTVGDSTIFDNGTNVGIGTTSPESRLHIYELGVDSPTTLILENGDVGINNTEDVHKIEFQSNDGSVNGVGVAASIRVNAENAGNIYALAFNTQNVADRGERMRIDGAGNVGIGVTDPQAKLHVANGTLRTWSPTTGTSAIFESTVANRNFVTLTATSQAELWFGDATTQAKGRVRYDMSSNEMQFWTSQAKKMVINSSGSVSIGTASPANSTKLHVLKLSAGTNKHYDTYATQILEDTEARLQLMANDGGTNAAAILLSNENKHFVMHHQAGDNAFHIGYSTTTVDGDIVGATPDFFSILNSGNIGIGTTDPDGKLHIDGITSTLPGIVLEVAENSAFNKIIEIQNTSASKRFGIEYDNVSIRLGITDRSGSIIMSFVEGTKYVGIGKTNPSFPLDVVGEIHSTTFISATNGLGVDSTGMGEGRGISLYGGPYLYPQYGLLFATTADLGTHGSVTSDYATFFTMNNTSGRGWVFKAGTVNSTSGNVASINGAGAMTLNSTATATNFILSSDERLKENIQDFDCEQYIKMDVKTYELKSEKGIKRTGVIAQELEVNHPEFVRTDEEGMKSVAYTDLLMAKIAELEARLEKAGI